MANFVHSTREALKLKLLTTGVRPRHAAAQPRRRAAAPPRGRTVAMMHGHAATAPCGHAAAQTFGLARPNYSSRNYSFRAIFSVALEFDLNCQALWGAWQFESNSNAWQLGFGAVFRSIMAPRRSKTAPRPRGDRKRHRDNRKRQDTRKFRRLDLNYR